MAIKEKEVSLSVNGRNYKYFEEKGYKIPRYFDKNNKVKVDINKKILVKIEDLQEGSRAKVTKICDVCKVEIPFQPYFVILRHRKNIDGKDRCHLCGNRVNREFPVDETNCIAKTNTEFAKMFWDKKDTYKYTCQSHKRVDFKCLNCGNKIKNKKIQAIFIAKKVHCNKCADGFKFPEKFMIAFLKQLEIEYETQKIFTWAKDKRYDFYIKDLNVIIETHGIQHYKENTYHKISKRTFGEEQENDKEKKSLANLNGINEYYQIDCSESDLEYIKANIMKSPLNKLFDLTNIDWIECLKFASSTIVKDVSDLWNKGYKVKEIKKELKLSQFTVTRYLKQGKILGWCTYDSVEESSKNGRKQRKAIVQLSENLEFIKRWISQSEASRELNISSGNISLACIGKQKTSGGFKWMFEKDYEEFLKKQN